MSNENIVGGLIPVPDNKGFVNTRDFVPVGSGNTVDLFVGSPYYMVSGAARGVPLTDTDATDKDLEVAGAIVKLYNSSMVTVQNLPSSTAGYAEVTFEPNQQYLCTIDDTGFADNGSDNGDLYNLKAETNTDANADGFSGSGRSGVKLKGSTEATSDRQMAVSRKTQRVGNVGGVAGTEVFCTIHPDVFQEW
jgi:hypothetical protein